MTLLLVLMALVSTAIATNQTSMNQDIIIATQEMQKANYFTFVTLINMAPSKIIQGGITFLMPNDRTLSKVDMSESSVGDFLLRHSIPSPLLIDHLEHFPTGSMIPTSKPRFMFKVTNHGRRRIFLSNVRIISPNICTKGSSIRCHGIDRVLRPEITPQPILAPPLPSTCSNNSSSPRAGVAGPAPSPVVADGGFIVTAVGPPLVVKFGTPNSGHLQMIGHGGGFEFYVMTLFMLGAMELLNALDWK